MVRAELLESSQDSTKSHLNHISKLDRTARFWDLLGHFLSSKRVWNDPINTLAFQRFEPVAVVFIALLRETQFFTKDRTHEPAESKKHVHTRRAQSIGGGNRTQYNTYNMLPTIMIISWYR